VTFETTLTEAVPSGHLFTTLEFVQKDHTYPRYGHSIFEIDYSRFTSMKLWNEQLAYPAKHGATKTTKQVRNLQCSIGVVYTEVSGSKPAVIAFFCFVMRRRLVRSIDHLAHNVKTKGS